MKKVPKGKLTTINHLRETLAKKHGATIACPICVGIFARTAAGAAEEEVEDGKKRITPYWRTLRSGGEVNAKYPGGIEAQRTKLEEEGHVLLKKGKRYVVENFERKVAKLG